MWEIFIRFHVLPTAIILQNFSNLSYVKLRQCKQPQTPNTVSPHVSVLTKVLWELQAWGCWIQDCLDSTHVCNSQRPMVPTHSDTDSDCEHKPLVVGFILFWLDCTGELTLSYRTTFIHSLPRSACSSNLSSSSRLLVSRTTRSTRKEKKTTIYLCRPLVSKQHVTYLQHP